MMLATPVRADELAPATGFLLLLPVVLDSG